MKAETLSQSPAPVVSSVRLEGDSLHVVLREGKIDHHTDTSGCQTLPLVVAVEKEPHFRRAAAARPGPARCGRGPDPCPLCAGPRPSPALPSPHVP